MRRRWKIVLTAGILPVTAIVVTSLIGRFGPTLRANLVQDRCSFNQVSNAQYLKMLEQARVAERVAPSLVEVEQNDFVSHRLQQRLDGMLFNRWGYAEKIAAVHATMRSLGGIYRSTLSVPERGTTKLLSEKTVEHATKIRYGYYLDGNRYLSFLWLRARWIAVFVDYYTDKAPYDIRGKFVVRALLPEFDYLRIPVASKEQGGPCPVVPNRLP